ncbi:acetylornithine deacetylase [Acetobacter sp. TBRC 12305]|nr:acetylornithine deacetylase [Acetobacter garciniae]
MSTEAILARLVAYRTVSETSNAELIGWVGAWLGALDAQVEIVPDDQPGRFGLWARIGPPTADGIILSAHSDVVPVAGQAWSTDPFELSTHEGRLYGRGTSDMKGFLACMLTAARLAAQGAARGEPLARPLHLAISCDEEIGCVGVRSLLRFLRERQVRAAGCVVGEPTMLSVVTRHKGKIAGRIVCHGVAAHSANPSKGCNAIGVATRMYAAIEAVQAQMMAQADVPGFEVGHSTAHVGLIHGGVALNIVPERCEMRFELRLLPGEDARHWLAQLDARAREVEQAMPGARVEIAVTNAYPGLSQTHDTAFLNTMQALAHGQGGSAQDAAAVPPAQPFGAIDFGTEAGLFEEQLGLPVLVCGPGSIARAHKADEYITREELHAGEAFVARIVQTLRA